jgi:hypothetical protein
VPPPVGTDFDYQLGGASEPAPNVGIVARDRTEAPAPGRYNICYVNAFQAQPDEKPFWRKHPALVLKRHGKPVVDSAWGEWLLDVGTKAKRIKLARIMTRWIEGCAADGFDAVEFDNLDSYTRSHKLLTRGDATRFAGSLVKATHEAGLAAGQKNLADWDGTAVGFDFAVAEECSRWHECDDYLAHYGDQVLMIEYRRVDFDAGCAGYGSRVAIVLRDLDLSPDGVREWC